MAEELSLESGRSGFGVPTTGQPGAEGRAMLLSPALSCPLRAESVLTGPTYLPPSKKKKAWKSPNVRAEKAVLQISPPFVLHSLWTLRKKDSPTHFIDDTSRAVWRLGKAI